MLSIAVALAAIAAPSALAFCPSLAPMVVANVPLKDVTTGSVTTTDWVMAMSTASFAFPPGDQYPSACANEASFVSSQVARYDRNPNPSNPPVSSSNGNCSVRYDHRVSWVDLSSGGCTYRVINQNTSAIAAINIECGLTSGFMQPSNTQTSLYNGPFSFSSIWFNSAVMCQSIQSQILPVPPTAYPLLPGAQFTVGQGGSFIGSNSGGYDYRRSYPPCGNLWSDNYVSATARAAVSARTSTSRGSIKAGRESRVTGRVLEILLPLSEGQRSRALELLERSPIEEHSLQKIVQYALAKDTNNEETSGMKVGNASATDYQAIVFLCTYACGHSYGDSVSTLQQLVMYNQLMMLAQFVAFEEVIQPVITGVVFDAFTVNAQGGIDSIDDSSPLDLLLTGSDCLGGQQTGVFNLIGAIRIWKGYESYLAPTSVRNFSQPWDPRDFPPNPSCADRMSRLRLLLANISATISYISQQFNLNSTSINGFYVDLDPGAECGSLVTNVDRDNYGAFITQLSEFTANYYGGGLLSLFVAVGSSALTNGIAGETTNFSPNLWTSATTAADAMSEITTRVGQSMKPTLVTSAQSMSVAETNLEQPLATTSDPKVDSQTYFVPQMVMTDTSSIMRYDAAFTNINTSAPPSPHAETTAPPTNQYVSQFGSLISSFVGSVAPLASACGATYISGSTNPAVDIVDPMCTQNPRAVVGLSSDTFLPNGQTGNFNVSNYFSVLRSKSVCQLFIDSRDVVDPVGNIGNAYTISTAFLSALELHRQFCWGQ